MLGIETYLAGLDLTAPARTRIDEVRKAFQVLNSDIAVETLFVADRVNEDTGTTSFYDVWGFTDTFLLASRDFLTSGNADVSPYKNSISYIGLEYTAFPFAGEPQEDWRLSVELETGGGHTYSQISAVGRNVGHLADIVQTLLIPHLRTDMLRG